MDTSNDRHGSGATDGRSARPEDYTFNQRRDFWLPRNRALERMTNEEIAENPEAFKSYATILLRSAYPSVLLIPVSLALKFIFIEFYYNMDLSLYASKIEFERRILYASSTIVKWACGVELDTFVVPPHRWHDFVGFLALNLFVYAIYLASLIVMVPWYYASFRAGLRLPAITQIALSRPDISLPNMSLPVWIRPRTPGFKDIGRNHGRNKTQGIFFSVASALSALYIISHFCEHFMFGAPGNPHDPQTYLIGGLYGSNIDTAAAYGLLGAVVPAGVFGFSILLGYLRMKFDKANAARAS